MGSFPSSVSRASRQPQAGVGPRNHPSGATALELIPLRARADPHTRCELRFSGLLCPGLKSSAPDSEGNFDVTELAAGRFSEAPAGFTDPTCPHVRAQWRTVLASLNTLSVEVIIIKKKDLGYTGHLFDGFFSVGWNWFVSVPPLKKSVNQLHRLFSTNHNRHYQEFLCGYQTCLFGQIYGTIRRSMRHSRWGNLTIKFPTI